MKSSFEKKITISDAKKIPIFSVLQTMGHLPNYYKPGKIAWYFSPFREERTPSFKLDLNTNTWFDFGEGSGGDIINFIQFLHNCDTREALSKLSNLSNNTDVSVLSIAPTTSYKPSGIKILEVTSIREPVLVAYLKSRCIAIDLASNYCNEILYSCHNRQYRAIGFKNDKNGYELRSPTFKGKTCDATTTLPVPNSETLNIFEGFFDFLSAMTYFSTSAASETTLILNSTNKTSDAKIGELTSLLTIHRKVFCYFDNDEHSHAGEKATQRIKEINPETIDCSSIYSGFKDFNEFLINKSNISKATQF